MDEIFADAEGKMNAQQFAPLKQTNE